MIDGVSRLFARKEKRAEHGNLYVPFLTNSFDSLARNYGPLRALHSPHSRDLRWIVSSLFALSMVFLIYLFVQDDVRAPLIAFGFVGAVITTTFLLYQMGKRRFATVDLFGMEMLSIIRLFVITRFVHSLTTIYGQDSKDGTHISARRFRSEASAAFLEAGFAASFATNSESLGTLSARVVDYTTCFYTFFGSVKEHTRSLLEYFDKAEQENRDPDPETVDKYVGLIIYLVDILALVGFRAINELVEAKSQNLIARQLCLVVGAAANNFLTDTPHYRSDEKWPLIIVRREFYESEIIRLKRELGLKH